MTVSHPLMFAARTVSRAHLRAMLAPAPSLAEWARMVLPTPLQRYQVDLLNRMEQAHGAGQQLHAMFGRQLGWSNFRNLLASLAARNAYLAEYGEPWAVAMRAPEHVRANPINQALRAFYPLKRESV